MTLPFLIILRLGRWAWLQIVGVAIHCRSRTVKAIEAAIQAKQWSKVVQIVDLQESSVASRYYLQIAQHYRGIKNYQVRGCGSVGVADHSFQLAEKYYLLAEATHEAVDMYNEVEMIEEAYRVTMGRG